MTALPHVSIDEALSDPALLGAALGDDKTWTTWLAVLRSAFGLGPADESQRRAFRRVSGGRTPPTKRVSEMWVIAGRRSGKSRAAGAVSSYLATLVDHSDKLAPGEIGYILVLSPSVRQSRLVYNYAWSFLQSSPILRQCIDNCTTEEIRLTNGIIIATHPSSFRSVRGRTLLAVVADESAFWRSEESANPDVETYTAVLPALATTHGMLIGISSPYRKVGLLHQKFRDHFGKDDDTVLVVRGATAQFNPTIDAQVIDAARKSDPAAAMSEWDAEFRTDLTSFLDDATVDAAIDYSRPLELRPRQNVQYFAFADASGGRHDAFTICVGHREGDGDDARFVADVIRGRKPPFDPRTVAQEYAALARDYRCTKVIADAYSGEWSAEAFASAGMPLHRSDLAKSQLYLEALPQFARGAVSIPDLPILVRELRLLERRTHRSGKDTVDHNQGGSDDYANVLVGAMRAAGMGRQSLEVHVAIATGDMTGPSVPYRPPPAPIPQTANGPMLTQRDIIVRSDPRFKPMIRAFDRARRR